MRAIHDEERNETFLVDDGKPPNDFLKRCWACGKNMSDCECDEEDDGDDQ